VIGAARRDLTKGPAVANVGFFARLGNLWKGFLSLWISDVEKGHPEIAYENAINSLIEKYTRLKAATAAIIRRREDLSERFAQANKDLAQTEAELGVALDTNQDDVAVVLLQKKNQLTADIADLKGDLDTAQKDADSAKSSLVSVQGEIRKLKTERDSMLAKMQSAQARIKIQEQLDGLSVDAEVKALDGVREHIKNTIAQANLGKELSESSLDSKLAAVRSQVGEVQAKQQLEELKAKRAAAKAAQGQKTL
jgi:phage shock protein A